MQTTSLPAREIASGLDFPEGPVARRDGSVLLVEIGRATLSRVAPEGRVSVVAEPGGGPNGAAIGPDGAVYVCNNGGFAWTRFGEMRIPLDLQTGTNAPADFGGGWIERIDPTSGAVEVLYRECDGDPFVGPNDLVFDREGGFWFTDFGKVRRRTMDRGALYYAKADGSSVRCVVHGLHGPNGVGLSPAGDRVYVAETYTGRLLCWDVTAPGRVRDDGAGNRGRILVATPCHFDSLAVEEDGTVVVAAITHGLCVVRPDGTHELVAVPDPMVTNVCFGGPDRRTAFVTGSGTGKLFAVTWPRPGAPLAWEG